jgi:hypothetical protein
MTNVTEPVGFKFGKPKFQTRFWEARERAPDFSVSMPKATVDENQLVSRSQHDIGHSREILGMEAVPISKSMDNSTDL